MYTSSRNTGNERTEKIEKQFKVATELMEIFGFLE